MGDGAKVAGSDFLGTFSMIVFVPGLESWAMSKSLAAPTGGLVSIWRLDALDLSRITSRSS